MTVSLKSRIAKQNKYNAKPVADGYMFDSSREHQRYCELRLLERAKEISELMVHPAYQIHINGKSVCIVELDFKYRDKNGVVHIEDVKGVHTALSNLKRKLVEASEGVTVELRK